MQRLTLRGGQAADVDLHAANEYRRGKLVCETAGSIAKLVKLKVDAVKVFRKLEEANG